MDPKTLGPSNRRDFSDEIQARHTSLSTSLLIGFPFLIALSAISTLLVILSPDAGPVAAIAPLLLCVTSKSVRPLLAACFAGNMLMLFGAAGEVEYLGYLTIDSSTSAFAIAFSNVFAISIATISNRSFSVSRDKATQIVPLSLHAFLLIGSAVVLLARFTSGIPLLQGDASRLNGLLTVNPYLGLLSGVLPITAAFLTSKKSKLTVTLKVIVAILVLGTASRLLLGGYLVGLATSSSLMSTGRVGKRQRFYIVLGGVLAIVSIIKIYTARTAEGIQQVYENRLQDIGGVAGWISDILGPSIFYAARNGLVVHEVLQNYDSRPPNGFIFGGLLHAINLAPDPELWMTTAVGFSATSVGAVATPVWAGANADFGSIGGLLVAAIMGALMAFVLRWVPNLRNWFAFGILLSFYGSYLVSMQFLAASVVITGVVLWNNARLSRDSDASKLPLASKV
ncbi:hypothetical protein [Arthrobacter sp. NyZ413]|uniref:hypothetical protein n=1 Tax=Arthrobacter sp. NyZ413 TaxID=3144669 RepID=UPI003BF7AA72